MVRPGIKTDIDARDESGYKAKLWPVTIFANICL